MNIIQKIRVLIGLNDAYKNAVSEAQKEVGMTSKSVFTSWTLWFNLIAGVYEVLDHTGVMKVIPPPWDALVVVMGNILLRFKTSQPVSLVGGTV